MNDLTNEILHAHGGTQANYLGNILEPEDESDTNEFQLNLLSVSPYTDINNVSEFVGDNDFHIMSLNCRSLNSCIDNLKYFIDSMKNKDYTIHCIALQETWLTEHNTHMPSLSIDGYEFVNVPCKLSRHSGVAFYVISDYKLEVVNNQQTCSTFEYLTIKVLTPNKNIILTNVYRPPKNNLANFNDEMESLLDTTQTFDNVIVLGDFNINLLEVNHKTLFQEYLDIFYQDP